MKKNIKYSKQAIQEAIKDSLNKKPLVKEGPVSAVRSGIAGVKAAGAGVGNAFRGVAGNFQLGRIDNHMKQFAKKTEQNWEMHKNKADQLADKLASSKNRTIAHTGKQIKGQLQQATAQVTGLSKNLANTVVSAASFMGVPGQPEPEVAEDNELMPHVRDAVKQYFDQQKAAPGKPAQSVTPEPEMPQQPQAQTDIDSGKVPVPPGQQKKPFIPKKNVNAGAPVPPAAQNVPPTREQPIQPPPAAANKRTVVTPPPAASQPKWPDKEMRLDDFFAPNKAQTGTKNYQQQAPNQPSPLTPVVGANPEEIDMPGGFEPVDFQKVDMPPEKPEEEVPFDLTTKKPAVKQMPAPQPVSEPQSAPPLDQVFPKKPKAAKKKAGASARAKKSK